MTTAEYKKRYQQKMKTLKRCQHCGTQDERTLAGFVRCEFCSKKAKLLYREKCKVQKNERNAQEET